MSGPAGPGSGRPPGAREAAGVGRGPGRGRVLAAGGAAALAARFLGAALVLAACDPPAALHAEGIVQALVVVAVVLAWWAAPMVDERPSQSSMRWTAIASRRRGTVLAAASVVVAALSDPPSWVRVCVAALLLAYLLLTDAWTNGVTAPDRRPAPGPGIVTAAACALVLLAAEVPLSHTAWARLLTALVVAVTTVCLVLALRHRGAAAAR